MAVACVPFSFSGATFDFCVSFWGFFVWEGEEGIHLLFHLEFVKNERKRGK